MVEKPHPFREECYLFFWTKTVEFKCKNTLFSQQNASQRGNSMEVDLKIIDFTISKIQNKQVIPYDFRALPCGSRYPLYLFCTFRQKRMPLLSANAAFKSTVRSKENRISAIFVKSLFIIRNGMIPILNTLFSVDHILTQSSKTKIILLSS